MSIWNKIKDYFTKSQSLKDEFLQIIAEEVEKTPEEIKQVVKVAKAPITKPAKKQLPEL